MILCVQVQVDRAAARQQNPKAAEQGKGPGIDSHCFPIPTGVTSSLLCPTFFLILHPLLSSFLPRPLHALVLNARNIRNPIPCLQQVECFSANTPQVYCSFDLA